ncbi:Laminarase-resistance protein LRE1 [Nakaseomyces bracarensis]|uniref:Laminarase-resistance protein LRE1 n=1 Tax=Nakaseomyces bracarensis TaxID=273131 RepID=A0ABR4NYR2_9SACH
MTDTQHLKINIAPPPVVNAPGDGTPPLTSSSNFSTPSKRGHRHKRSFAISGDFEFLKQPPATAPRLNSTTLSPDMSVLSTPPQKNSFDRRPSTTHNFPSRSTEEPSLTFVLPPKNTNSNIENAEMLSPLRVPPNAANNFNLSTPSPRFFVSEEPRFTSPCKGVPDAIINLDDALNTTKPRSFQSHRRTESAPAFLEIMLNGKSGNNFSENALLLEEEEDSIDERDEFSNPGSPKKLPARAKSQNDHASENQDILPPGLMSPLRPTSPLKEYGNNVSKNMKEGTDNPSACENNKKYNSLKIKRQKQRYSHYTRQLPTKIPNTNNNSSNSNVQAQSIREQTSSTSLASSGNSKSPLSVALTPSKNTQTPATPASFNDNSSGSTSNKSNLNSTSYHNGLDAPRFPMSPFRSYGGNAIGQLSSYKQLNNQQTYRRNSAGSVPSNTFSYEPKIYDIPPIANRNTGKVEDDAKDSEEPLPMKEKSPFSYNSSPYITDNDTINKISTGREIEGIDETFSRDKISQVSSSSTNNNVFVNENRQLSSEILLGEPGDAVDLSSLNSQNREALARFSALGLEDRAPSPLLPIQTGSSGTSSRRYDNLRSIESRPATPDSVLLEGRHASDSAVEFRLNTPKTGIRSASLNKNHKDHKDDKVTSVHRKHKSRLDKFINMFSKK